ncbi:MAG: YHS domain protein [Halobacteriovoraceae bacterium]|nr:YHS domain protein [Halobacteriovoraceae bacterium]
MNNLALKSVIGAWILLVSVSCATARTNKSSWSDKAVDGKDVVELYQTQDIIEGKGEFKYEYEGAYYEFRNQENLDLFKSNPKKYAPAYGGYCAWAVAQGYTADVDLRTATVVEGVLYLNYNSDIAAKWSENQAEFIRKADRNWPDINK